MKNLIIVLTIISAIALNAQNEYSLEEIVVSSGRIPSTILNSTKDIRIIDKLEIQKLSISNIAELVNYVSGLDVRQRGIEGTQADVSIRGGTFSQTLIMIDGIKISDPQTAHHNMNIPLNMNDIERIEIVNGQASKSFGPNAFSGIINIITKKYSEDEIFINLQGGSFNSYLSEFSLAKNLGDFNNRISFSKIKSDGYKHNSEFDNINFHIQSNLNLEKFHSTFSFGYLDKDFGANSFYSIKYPDQAERTITKFLSLQNNFLIAGEDISSKIFWRRNNDDFVLKKFQPTFYKNLHVTNTYGTELQTTFEVSKVKFTIGGDVTIEEINSTNLGSHSRQNFGFFFETLYNLNSYLNINLGGFLYSINNSSLEFWPGIDLKYKLSENSNLFFSVGKAFRSPSYTELFYKDPITLNNAKLQREETLNYEASYDFSTNFLSSGLSVFYKYNKNLIDWVRNSSVEKWISMNISKLRITGAEINFSVNTSMILRENFLRMVTVNYTNLDFSKSSAYKYSKYITENLQDKLNIMLQMQLPFNIDFLVSYFYEKRQNYKSQQWTDFNFSKKIDSLNLSFKIKNIFDEKLYDFWGIDLPGRNFVFNINYTFSY